MEDGFWEKDDIRLLIDTLGTAVGRALAESVPSPKTAKFTDVFVIRQIHNDPDMKAILESDFFAPEDKQGMSQIAEEADQARPYFPPECYLLLK